MTLTLTLTILTLTLIKTLSHYKTLNSNTTPNPCPGLNPDANPTGQGAAKG